MRFCTRRMDDTGTKRACKDLQHFFREVLENSSPQVCEELLLPMRSASKHYKQKRYNQALELYGISKRLLQDRQKLIASESTGDVVNESGEEFMPLKITTPVHYHEIVGLQKPKQLLQEIAIMPLKNPNLLLTPIRGVTGILLYGSSGCGKSLFAEATATELGAPFFNVQVSQLLSKYHGESANLVRRLFIQLRRYPTSVLFLDEVDAITGSRDGTSSGSQMLALKSQLLQEISGVNANTSNSYVVILAATNIPDSLDSAFKSRFKYKILVKKPNAEERLLLIKSWCAKYGITITENTGQMLKQKTVGYSGRDVATAMSSLNFKPLNKILSAKYFSVETASGKYHICDKSDKNAVQINPLSLELEDIVSPTVDEKDVIDLFSIKRVSSTENLNSLANTWDVSDISDSEEKQSTCNDMYSCLCCILFGG